MANAVGLSADAAGAAVSGFLPDFARANHGHGFNTAGDHRRPAVAETEFGRAIGFLYGSNTLGAMFGAVLGEAYLIGALGLYGASVAAGAMLCIAAAIALLLTKFGAARYADLKTTGPIAHSKFPLSFDASYRPPWRLLSVSFGTGLIFLALEVIWFRFLRLYVASSPTAFAIMLAMVLAGIGVGGLVAGVVFRCSVD